MLALILTEPVIFLCSLDNVSFSLCDPASKNYAPQVEMARGAGPVEEEMHNSCLLLNYNIG